MSGLLASVSGVVCLLSLFGAAAKDALTITSPAFQHNQEIPAQHTCQGKDLSPAISWTGVPSGAKSLALIVDDPDAPDPKAPRMTWVHWVLYNLPPTTSGLAEAVRALPPGTREGTNDFQKKSYGGPCPPVGRHRYFFKLYALDLALPALEAPDKKKLLAAMGGHILAQAELIGTYEKKNQARKEGTMESRP